LLGEDPKAIFVAAGKAQQAVDFLVQEHERHATQKTLAEQERNGKEVPAGPAALAPQQIGTDMPGKLPPDPDGMNEKRTVWAEQAIATFRDATGTDREDAVTDLLADLMHWCDRNDTEFDRALRLGRMHYETETAMTPEIPDREPTLASYVEERENTTLNERSNTAMADEQHDDQQGNREPPKKPLYELKLGELQGAIHRNEGTKGGEFYSVFLFRTFTGRDGTEKTTSILRENDIPAAQQMLDQAQRCIQTERSQARPQEVTVTRSK
jgi:hypothetical protein